jgi:hypothetical protein
MMSSAAFVDGHFDKGLAENLIVLIPKDGRPTTKRSKEFFLL